MFNDIYNDAIALLTQLVSLFSQLGVTDTTMKDFQPTSRLPDPTGPDFNSYRGVLNPETGARIKKSTAFNGCLDPTIKINYESVARSGEGGGRR